MKRQKKQNSMNLALHLTIFVFLIMTVSGTLVSLLGYLGIRLGLFAKFFSSPFYLILSLLIVSVSVGTLISAIFSKISVKRLNRLVSALQEVKEGNFDVRLPRVKAPNVDKVAQNFNSMAQELGSIETLRNDFATNFSHEFKTPIVSIRGFAKLLNSGNVSEAEKKEYLDIIFTEADRLSVLAENTLLLSRLETQERVTDKKPYSLDEQLRRCVLLLENDWNLKNINVNIDLPEINITADEDLLSQLWINLIANAVKFTPENGLITISTAVDNGSVAVKIADSGCGMDESTLFHLFDKYFQGDVSRTNPGNGLGLAIAKRVVTLCGGNISVQSLQNEGSCFCVTLPLC